MNVELEWDFSDPSMRSYVDGFQITPLVDRVSGNRVRIRSPQRKSVMVYSQCTEPVQEPNGKYHLELFTSVGYMLQDQAHCFLLF